MIRTVLIWIEIDDGNPMIKYEMQVLGAIVLKSKIRHENKILTKNRQLNCSRSKSHWLGVIG